MRVAIAQLNPIVGDVSGNTRLVLDAIDRAIADEADVLVTSELVLVGYPPRDLLFRQGIVEACEAAAAEIARHAGARDAELTVLVGHPRCDVDGVRAMRNSVSVCRGGEVRAHYDKRLLPGYDVFDEDRYFEPGNQLCIIEVAGRRCGIAICEDLWRADDVDAERCYEADPVRELARAGCDVVLSPNASPFVTGKWQRHLDQLRATAASCRLPIVAVNEVGGNDDLVFDGRSVAVDASGRVLCALPGWSSAVETIDLDANPMTTVPTFDPLEEIFETLVLGVRDYAHKIGQRQALVGLSGGIDSAVTAVVTARALGGENVAGVAMPSKFSSPISLEDAAALSANLGLRWFPEAPIATVHESVREVLSPLLEDGADGVTDENVQARLRGLYLMAFSNAGHGLVMATSNKSEMAVGFSTLYGDMCGAVAVIGDVLKNEVYELARWINANHGRCGFDTPPIPIRSIERPPTAELRHDQTDQDFLPPYDVLDEIVRRYVDVEESAAVIAAETGFEPGIVERWTRVIDQTQYKRDQAAVVLKVSPRAFGRGRPMPIVMKSLATRDPVQSRP
jgi:NAD+ synthetase